MANYVTASCGHPVVAVGAPNSPARYVAETSMCRKCEEFLVGQLRQSFDAGKAYGIVCKHTGEMPHSVPLDAEMVNGLIEGILDGNPCDYTPEQKEELSQSYTTGFHSV